MGIQIYIKKQALDRLGIGHTSTNRVLSTTCKCGAIQEEGEYCPDCESTAQDVIEPFTEIEGLPLLMCGHDNCVYHDANEWGTARAKILKFISEHSFTSDDWFET